MSNLAKDIVPVKIEEELKQSYLDYAMSVIVGRALPDVRDGLKPVHRRVLFAMHELNNEWNKPYKKSARIVGDVIGKYHPHGDSAVYDTIVRMAQSFSLRHMLIDGQGNFGSIDGDSAAAMRYTEIRMTRIAHALLEDLDKETVNFQPNYDESESIPVVMPTRIPNLLVNGSSGIAVGMATNIPPHNLSDIIKGCLALIENNEITIDELMEHIPGPDFPTGAIINGRAGIVQAYKTGRGRIYVRASASVEINDKSGRESIIVTEIPYQLNKARLIERIAELVKEKKIEGISELRDESDKDGLRVVVEIKRGEIGEVVLNNLYAQTQLQSVFGINIVALVDGQPKILNLKELLEAFISHRREVVTRRCIFLLRKARARSHTLAGFAIALVNIDIIISVIKNAENPAEARAALLGRAWIPGSVEALLERAGNESSVNIFPSEDGFGLIDGQYYLSPNQARDILDLRLHRLTGLEQQKILDEATQKFDEISEYQNILSDTQKLMAVIKDELESVITDFSDPRRTQIVESQHDLTVEDLIAEEDRVVTISHGGYAKTQPLSDYQAQRRGGMGKSAIAVKEADFVEHLLIASTHATILCFTSAGKVYWLKVYQIPVASRNSKGRPVINLLPLDAEERINSILPVEGYSVDHYVIMATANGTVKKTQLSQYSNPRKAGLRAVELVEGDVLVGTAVISDRQDIMLFSSEGKAVRFASSDVRPMGRVSKGVRGMRLTDGAKVISMVIPEENGYLLTVCDNGFGKRTECSEFPTKGRGGKGMIAIQASDRNGPLVGATQLFAGDQIMLISDQGTMVRTRSEEVSVVGRNTQGVRVIRLKHSERLVSLARIAEAEEMDILERSDGA
ncbi:MAG: DNA gyrase subunit A [Porticoccaceae bacterium]|nr:DNA gyrase subunit A [Porticoccaceae bacterium]